MRLALGASLPPYCIPPRSASVAPSKLLRDPDTESKRSGRAHPRGAMHGEWAVLVHRVDSHGPVTGPSTRSPGLMAAAARADPRAPSSAFRWVIHHRDHRAPTRTAARRRLGPLDAAAGRLRICRTGEALPAEVVCDDLPSSVNLFLHPVSLYYSRNKYRRFRLPDFNSGIIK
jgi:hypothetical protein